MNVILELGCNHNGSMDSAKRMIDEAALLNVRGVKMQKRDIESIPDAVKCLPRLLSNSFGTTYYEHRKALEFDAEQMLQLRNHAEAQKLIFACSAFDVPSIELLVSIGVQYIKLPSQLLNNSAMNDAIIAHRECTDGLRIWNSTGMHTTQEVVECPYTRFFDVTYYCRSIYPCLPQHVDVASAVRIYKHVNGKGYSSHDKYGTAIPYFVIAGADWIERHFTLSKTMKGSDHGTVSSDFNEMQRILRSIEAVQECKYANKLSDLEQKVRDMYIGDGK